MELFINKKEATERINKWSKEGVPFLMFCNYHSTLFFVEKLCDIDSSTILYDINGLSNSFDAQTPNIETEIEWQAKPIDYENYQQSFSIVKDNILKGNSYLVNLTHTTPINTNVSMRSLFFALKAQYKLWVKNHFIVFSPEPFVRIEGKQISSFPMKGTIDGAVPNAESCLMADKKETAEHATIVDLIRNDLSQVANNVHVKRYRYVEKINTPRGEILQTSSEICGTINDKWNLGEILTKLLPAGSITGAPKNKTQQIIAEAETNERGFYTGICGIYNGKKFDSGVMIRFVEDKNEQLLFHSGGGITAMSSALEEYNEMIIKTNAPICRNNLY